MKTVIIYESKHHGNTKKLCDAIAGIGSVDLIEAKKVNEGISWADYNLIGFASGIAYGNFYRNVRKAASQLPVGAKTFYLYTCARNDKDFAAGIKAIVCKDDEFAVNVRIDTGHVDFVIAMDGNNPIYKGNDIEDGEFNVIVPADGAYRITVNAKHASEYVEVYAKKGVATNYDN